MHTRRVITFTLTVLALTCVTTLAQSQASTTTLALPNGKAASGAFRFVALGDTGTGGAGQLAVAGQMTVFHEERPYDTVLLLGDNIYAGERGGGHEEGRLRRSSRRSGT